MLGCISATLQIQGALIFYIVVEMLLCFAIALALVDSSAPGTVSSMSARSLGMQLAEGGVCLLALYVLVIDPHRPRLLLIYLAFNAVDIPYVLLIDLPNAHFSSAKRWLNRTELGMVNGRLAGINAVISEGGWWFNAIGGRGGKWISGARHKLYLAGALGFAYVIFAAAVWWLVLRAYQTLREASQLANNTNTDSSDTAGAGIGGRLRMKFFKRGGRGRATEEEEESVGDCVSNSTDLSSLSVR